MDEQFALISIMDALRHAKNLYELFLHDSLYNEDYKNRCGFNHLLDAMSHCQDSIMSIEDSIQDDV